MTLLEIAEHYKTHTRRLERVLWRNIQQGIQESVVLVTLSAQLNEADRKAVRDMVDRRSHVTTDLQEAIIDVLEDIAAMTGAIGAAHRG